MKYRDIDSEMVIESLMYASKNIIESGVPHPPILVVVSRKLGELVIGLDEIETVGEQNMEEYLRDVLTTSEADSYAVISEGWIGLTADPETQRALDEGSMKVCDLPLDDRKLVVFILFCSKKCPPRLFVADVIFNEQGQKQLSEFKEETSINLSDVRRKVYLPDW